MIILTNGTQREYLVNGIDGDNIDNARQVIDLSANESYIIFDLAHDSEKWALLKGMDCDIECLGRKYCVFGEDAITLSRDTDNVFLRASLKEIWYKLAKQYTTCYNISITESTEFDHIDRHMVELWGNSPDQLYIWDESEKPIAHTSAYTVGTAQYHFDVLLKGTGWTLDPTYANYWPDGKYDLRSFNESILGNIITLQTFFGGFLMWDSMNKRVALVDEKKYQVYNGFDVRYQANLVSIERREDRNIITRLNVYGNGGLNIRAVNNDKEYLDNFTYTNQVFEDSIINNDIYSQESLLAWGKRMSVFYGSPRYDYAVNLLIHPYQTDRARARPEIGKLAGVIDKDVVVESFKHRVLKLDQNIFVEYDCAAVIGDSNKSFERTFTDIDSDAGKAGDTIDKSGKLPGKDVSGEVPQHTRNETKIREEVEETAQGIYSFVESEDKKLNTLISQTATEIRLEANDLEKRLNSSISITAGQIRSEVNDLGNKLQSSITQTASSIRSEIRSLESDVYSEIDQRIDSISLSVSNGSTSSRLTLKAGSTTLNSVNITFDGFVTFTGLSGGTTTIDGACIKTGTIDANRISANIFSASRVLSIIASADDIYAKAIDVSGNLHAGTVDAENLMAGSLILDGRIVRMKSISGQTGRFLYVSS